MTMAKPTQGTMMQPLRCGKAVGQPRSDGILKVQNARSHVPSLAGATLGLRAPEGKVHQDVHLNNWSDTTSGDETAGVGWRKLAKRNSTRRGCLLILLLFPFFFVIMKIESPLGSTPTRKSTHPTLLVRIPLIPAADPASLPRGT